ncbi:MAG: sulfatase-like hydrolase/transferase [Opitutales bacterium]
MPPPNILIFMTDQQRGNTVLPEHLTRTPVLDRFRQDAATLDHAYTCSPHCCPSRASFFTGLYPTEHGVWNNINVQNAHSRGPIAGTRYWFEDLREAGYRLEWDGKWHVDTRRTPVDLGWNVGKATAADTRIMGMHWDKYRTLAREPQPSERAAAQILRPGYSTYRHYGTQERPFGDADVVEHAIEKLRTRSNDGTPWCQFVGTLGPHDPYIPPQSFVDLYDPAEIELPPSFHDRMDDKPGFYRRTRGIFDQLTEDEHREAIRHYLAFCSYEDWLFGQVLEALEASGQAENTVVVYLSDHGDYLGDHGLWCKGLPCFEGAYHIPCLVRWPGVTDGAKGRRESAFVSLTDFAPTFLEMAGVVTERAMSGRSLVPLLRAEPPPDWPDAVFTQSNGNELYGIQRSVRTREWKYVYNGFDFDELYDLQADPHEFRNLASDPQYQPVIREMCQRLWRFAEAHGEQAVNDYIMVGFAPYGPAIAFDQAGAVNAPRTGP